MARRSQNAQLVHQIEQFLPTSVKRSPYYRPLMLIVTLALAAFGYSTTTTNTTQSASGSVAKGSTTTCYIEKIYDGDTVTAHCNQQKIRIRMIGIDAPEMGQKPYGEQAKQALQKMLPKQFQLESAGTDRYARTLGTLHVNGKNINLEMVRQGAAVAYADKATPKIYRDAEAEAKSARRGVWREAGLHQDPKAWRKQNKSND